MPRNPPTTSVNLAEVTQEAIVSQRKHLRELTASRSPRSKCYGTDGMASPEQVDSASRALAALVKEARSIAKDAIRATSKLTPEEMRAEVVDWFRASPPEQQRLLLQELTRVHNDERKNA